MADDNSLSPSELDSDFNQLYAKRGYGNVANAPPPADAAAGIKYGPGAGIPPQTAMYAPQDAQKAAQNAERANVIQASPPVAKWAATANPASVAAAQNDLPQMDKISKLLSGWRTGAFNNLFSPFQDVADTINNSLNSISQAKENLHADAAKGDYFGVLKQAATEIMGGFGVAFSPTALIAGPGGRGLAQVAAAAPPNIPGLTQLNDLLEKAGVSADLSTPKAKKEFFQDTLTQMLLLGGGKSVFPSKALVSTNDIPGVGAHPVTDAFRAAAAESDATAAQVLQDEIAKTSFHAETPEVTKDFIESSNPNEIVHVNAAKLAQLVMDDKMDISDLHDFFDGQTDWDAFQNAALDGSDHPIPLSTYLAATAGKPWAPDVNAITTFREGGVSTDDSKEVLEGKKPPTEPVEGEAPPVEKPKLDLAKYNLEDHEVEPMKNAIPAIEAQVDKLVQELYLKDVFHDQKALELTKTQYEGYSESIRAAHQELYDKMVAKMRLAIKRQRTPQWQSAYTGNYLSAMNLQMRDPGIRVAYALKYGLESDAAAHAMKDESGQPVTFYHGTNHTNITQWDLSKTHRGGISFAEDNKFASDWAGQKDGSVVYITHVVPGKSADFRNPADVNAVADYFAKHWANSNPDQPNHAVESKREQYRALLAEGNWNLWENQAMLKALKFDSVRMNEYQGQSVPNIFVTNPDNILFKFASHGSLPEEIKLHPSTKDIYPKELIADLPQGIWSKDGKSADEVARDMGFANGTEMLQAVAQINAEAKARGTSIKGLIKAKADEAAFNVSQAQLGWDLSPQSIMNAVEDAVDEPVPQDALIQELRVLQSALGGKPLAKGDIVAYANDRFNRMNAKAATNVKQIQKQLYRAGELTQRALQKGDLSKAFIHKQQQYVQSLLLKRAWAWQKTYSKGLALFARTAAQKSIPSVGQDYLDQAHEVLAQLGYRVPQGNLKHNWLLWQEDQLRQGKPILPYAPLPVVSTPKAMIVQELDLQIALVQNLLHLGRDSQKITLARKQVDLAATVQAAVDGADKVPRRPVDTRAVPPTNVLHPAKLDAIMYSSEVMIDRLDDGDPNGVFNKVLMRGARDAAGASQQVGKPVMNALTELLDGLSHKDLDRLATEVPAGHGLMDPAYPSKEMRLLHRDLIGIALNAGTEFGRWHLEEGGLQWAPVDWKNVLEKYMTEGDWTIVRAIHDELGKMWPQVAGSERDMSGVAPEPVDVSEYQLSDGRTIKGGYFPLRRDEGRNSLLKGGAVEDIDTLMAHALYTATTPKGHIIKRKAAAYVPSLDWQFTLRQHIPNMVKRIAYGQYINDANKFLREPAIIRLVTEVHGPHGIAQLRNWLHRQVGYSQIDPRMPDLVSAIARELRIRSYAVQTGLKLAIGLEHATSIMQSSAIAGLEAPLRGYLSALINTIASPGSVHRFIEANSPYMMARHDATSRELRDMLDDVRNHRKILPFENPMRIPEEMVKKFTANFFNFINHWLVAEPTWWGAYHAALEGRAELFGKKLEAMGHDDAVAYADKVIGKSHGSGLELDMSQFQSGGHEIVKLTNMYNVFRGTIGHIAREATDRMFKSRGPREFAAALRQLLLGTMGVMVVGKLVTDQGPKSLAEVPAWLMDSLFDGMSYMLPYGNNLYRLGTNLVMGKPVDFDVSPAESTIRYSLKGGQDLGQIAKQIVTHKHTPLEPRAIQDIGDFLAFVTLLPFGQAGLTAQTVADMKHHHVQRPVQALAFGPSHEKRKK